MAVRGVADDAAAPGRAQPGGQRVAPDELVVDELVGRGAAHDGLARLLETGLVEIGQRLVEAARVGPGLADVLVVLVSSACGQRGAAVAGRELLCA